MRYVDWKYAVADESLQESMGKRLFSLLDSNLVFTELSEAKKYRMANVPKRTDIMKDLFINSRANITCFLRQRMHFSKNLYDGYKGKKQWITKFYP